MPGATAGSIRSVLSVPAVARTFALALVGRLAYGLLPLCLLFTIRDASGSFAVAATASAALGFATLAMPLQARLVDRHGQRRVLPCYASCYASLLVATAALSRGTHSDAVWVGLGLLLGLTAPALGPAMRAQWREIAPEGAPRRVAYSLDSVGEESLYLVGPLGASVVLATGTPRVGLLMAAAFVAIGVVGLVSSPYVPGTAAAPGAEAHHGTSISALRQQGFLGLLLVVALFGAGAAAGLVGVAALADRVGTPSAVGLAEAAMAVGAIVAGLAWARLRREPSWSTALVLLLLTAAAAEAGAVVAAPHLVLVGVLFVVTGAMAAPVYVVAFTAADGLVAPERRTEASTWVSTALNSGNAAGTALAGLLVTLGSAAPFGLAAGLTAGAAVLVLGIKSPGRIS
jgi:MFS family permease